MTPMITTGRKHTNPVDFAAKKFFVYTLSDARGVPLYVGRSCDVAGRIKAHYRESTIQRGGKASFKSTWVPDVRSVSMDGPFVWDEAVAEERRQIKAKRPRGNQMHNLAPTSADPYEKVVFIQGHRHSEPVCAWPNCQTYLTREQMTDMPEAAR